MNTVMKLCVLLGALSFLASPRVQAAESNSQEWYSLEGKPVPSGNAPDTHPNEVGYAVSHKTLSPELAKFAPNI